MRCIKELSDFKPGTVIGSFTTDQFMKFSALLDLPPHHIKMVLL